jgi:hypothetical protein
VDVGGASVVGVADEEVDVADDWGLGGELPNIGSQVVGSVSFGVASRFDLAVIARGAVLDETLKFLGRDYAGGDWAVISDGDVVERVALGIGGDGNDDGAVAGALSRATAVVKKELARERGGEIQIRDSVRVGHVTRRW